MRIIVIIIVVTDRLEDCAQLAHGTIMRNKQQAKNHASQA